MSPFTRVSASLVLTLAVWGPSAFAAIQRGNVDLGALSIRFVIVFALARVAMRWIDWLVRNYHAPENAPSARSAIHVDAADVAHVTATGPLRRRSDEELRDDDATGLREPEQGSAPDDDGRRLDGSVGELSDATPQ